MFMKVDLLYNVRRNLLKEPTLYQPWSVVAESTCQYHTCAVQLLPFVGVYAVISPLEMMVVHTSDQVIFKLHLHCLSNELSAAASIGCKFPWLYLLSPCAVYCISHESCCPVLYLGRGGRQDQDARVRHRTVCVYHILKSTVTRKIVQLA
jgi:hypothetical protein